MLSQTSRNGMSRRHFFGNVISSLLAVPGIRWLTWPMRSPRNCARTRSQSALRQTGGHGDLILNGATVHLLDSVHQPVSATAIREAVAAKKPLRKFVDAGGEEYIKKAGLYLYLGH